MPIYRVTLSGRYHQQLIQNVMNFEDDGAGAPNETDLALDISNNWVEQIRFLQNIEFQYTSITVQEMLPLRRNPIILSIATKTGTLAGAGAHVGIAAIFSFRTINPSRKGRGRFFMGGVHGASIDHSLVQSGALGQYVATATNLTTRYASGGTGPYGLRVGPRSYQNSADYLDVEAILARPYFGLIHTRNVNVGA
jgi:hypothetical protein